MTSLVDHSLVQRDGDDDEDRLSMLETVRECASELLAADSERAARRDRHAHVYLELAEEGGATLKGADQARWGRWLVRDLGNDEGVANTLLSLGNVAFDRGEPRAQALYEESLAIAERIGDTLGVAFALDNLGVLAWCRGDLGVTAGHTDAAAELYRTLDHRFGLASVLHRRGLLTLARGDAADAEEHRAACDCAARSANGAAWSEAEQLGQGWGLQQAVARARALLLAKAQGAA